MLTARLPLALESQLNRYAATNGVSKSFVVQEALQDYLLRHRDQASPPQQAPSGTSCVAPPLRPADRLLALGQELARKYPGADIDWREARDEGRK